MVARFWMAVSLLAICMMVWPSPVNPLWVRGGLRGPTKRVDAQQNLVATLNENCASVYDSSTGQPKLAYSLGSGATDVDISSDGAWLAIGTPSTVIILDIATGTEIGNIAAPGNFVHLFTRSGVRQLIAVGTSSAQLWTRSGAGTWSLTFTWNPGQVLSSDVRSDGLQVAFMTVSGCKVFGVATPSANPLASRGFSASLDDSASFSPSGARLAIDQALTGLVILETTGFTVVNSFATLGGASLVRWNTASSQLWVSTYLSGYRMAKWTPAGQMIWAGSPWPTPPTDAAVTQADEIVVGLNESTAPVTFLPDGSAIYSPLTAGDLVALAQIDSARIAVGSKQGWVYLLDAVTGVCLKAVNTGSTEVLALAASPAAKRIAVLVPNQGPQAGLRLYDSNLNLLQTAPYYVGNGPYQLKFSAAKVNGVHLLGILDEGVLQILGAPAGGAIATFYETSEITCFDFSRDSTKMVYAWAHVLGPIRDFNTANWAVGYGMEAGAPVQQITFGRLSNRVIAFRDDDFEAMGFNFSSSAGWIAEPPIDITDLDRAGRIALSPDGNTLLAARDAIPLDGTPRILMVDTSNLAVLRELSGGAFNYQSTGVTPFSYAQDGALIVQGLYDGQIYGAHANPIPVFINTVSLAPNPVLRGGTTTLSITLSRPALSDTRVSISYPSVRITGPTTLTPQIGATTVTAQIQVAANTVVGQYPITITLGRTVKPKLSVQ